MSTTQTVRQLRVPQHLNLHAWCLGVDSSKNKASLWGWQRELLPLNGHQQGPSTSQSGPYLKNGEEKIWWISLLYLYQDLNRHPSTIDGYRTATVDTLGPSGIHVAHNEDLHRLLFSFYRDLPPKAPEIFLSVAFLLFSMSTQNSPLSL